MSPPLDMPPTHDVLWMHIAQRLIGTAEVPGAAANPAILEMFRATGYKPRGDEDPWCSACVCHCLEKSGVRSTRSASAASYLTWGVPLAAPVYGCVAVIPRAVAPRRYHVTFFSGWVGSDRAVFRALGGNQSNSVCVSPYPARSAVFRWPSGYPVPPAGGV